MDQLLARGLLLWPSYSFPKHSSFSLGEGLPRPISQRRRPLTCCILTLHNTMPPTASFTCLFVHPSLCPATQQACCRPERTWPSEYQSMLVSISKGGRVGPHHAGQCLQMLSLLAWKTSQREIRCQANHAHVWVSVGGCAVCPPPHPLTPPPCPR